MTLREWRHKHKLSQIDLAKTLGVYQSTVSKWESYEEGHGQDRPSLDQAVALERLTLGKVKASSWVRAA